MIKARCPICAKAFDADPKALPAGFPFCSERCRLIDLGRWIDGDYAIPDRPVSAGPDRPPRGDEPTPEPIDDGDDLGV